jgi:iron uptake system EfeUOB component EfeO/EfeM
VSAWVALASFALVFAACGPTTGTTHGTAPADGAPTLPSATTRVTAGRSTAASAATRTFRSEITGSAAAFVAAIGNLQTAVTSGDTPGARTDEVAAQSLYDRFRLVESGNTINASTLDERRADVVPGTTFAGLHAVERDLWSSRDAAADLAGLAAQATVAEYLLSKTALDPEAIGTTAVDELSWVADVAIPGREEQYSHLDAIDIVATVGAAHDAFVTLEPLAEVVAPTLTASTADQFAALDREVAALGPPAQVPDSSISGAVRLALSQRVDATAAELAQVAARLAPFGTAGRASS